MAARRRHRLNRALKAVEGHRAALLRYLEGLVIVVTAHIASGLGAPRRRRRFGTNGLDSSPGAELGDGLSVFPGQQRYRAGDGVCEVIVGVRSVVDTLAPATRDTTLKADELIDQLLAVDEINAAAIDPDLGFSEPVSNAKLAELFARRLCKVLCTIAT